MAKAEPMRTCLACRAVKSKNELLRFVLTPDKVPAPDLLSKLPGRGAYTCIDETCVKNAVAKNQFSRAFRGEVKGASPEEMAAKVIAIMEERIASYVALANKAGKTVSGSDMVSQALRKAQKERIVITSTDISVDIREKVVAQAEKAGVECFAIFDKERLGALLGKGLRSVVAVEGHGFVSALKREIERLRNFMGGGQ